MTSVLEHARASDKLRSQSPLDRTDYQEMFVAATSNAKRCSAERWARAAIEGAHVTRVYAPLLWRLLGLEMGPRPSSAHVNGWTIAARGDDWIRLETRSAYATIHVVIGVEADEVQEAMFIRYDRPIARVIWGVVGPFHRRAMPGILRHAVKAL